MDPNAALIEKFYERFQARDGEGMAACYHDDVIFTDPVFGELRGERARNMWRMLAARAQDLTVTASEVRADVRTGSARWIATYSFGKARRPVTNDIRARFEFTGGRIVRHDDAFDLWRWARQALGAPGVLLGWAPPLRGRIRRDALRGLAAYERARTGGK